MAYSEWWQQILINGIVAGAIYGAVAIGFSLILRTSKFFDFSTAATLSVAGYTSYWVGEVRGLPLGLVLFAGVLAAILAGFLMESCVYRQLRHRGATPLILLLCSLGLMIVIINLVSLIFGDANKLIDISVGFRGHRTLGVVVTGLQFFIVLVSAIAAISCELLLRFSSWGLRVRAIADDESLASCKGIRIEHTILGATLLGSAIGGLMAILAAQNTNLAPYSGLNLLFVAVVVSIIGGVASPSWQFLTGLILGILQQFSVWYFGTGWQNVVLFLILLVVLFFRPQRLFGQYQAHTP